MHKKSKESASIETMHKNNLKMVVGRWNWGVGLRPPKQNNNLKRLLTKI